MTHTRQLTLYFFCSSFNSISGEVFFATSAGLLLWLGLLSLQYLVCFFPNINVLIRNISFWQFVRSTHISEFQHFREEFLSKNIFVKRTCFGTNTELTLFCCWSASVLDCLSDHTCHLLGCLSDHTCHFFGCLLGFTLWRDAIAYGNSSPLSSLKELFFGKWWTVGNLVSLAL